MENERITITKRQLVDPEIIGMRKYIRQWRKNAWEEANPNNWHRTRN